jgi:hypothetical protein
LKQQCAQFVAKERRAQITEEFFPFYFFIDHGRDGERVLPYVMHESRTRIIHSGTVVGHHCPRSQFTEKESLVVRVEWNF